MNKEPVEGGKRQVQGVGVADGVFFLIWLVIPSIMLLARQSLLTMVDEFEVDLPFLTSLLLHPATTMVLAGACFVLLIVVTCMRCLGASRAVSWWAVLLGVAAFGLSAAIFLLPVVRLIQDLA